VFPAVSWTWLVIKTRLLSEVLWYFGIIILAVDWQSHCKCRKIVRGTPFPNLRQTYAMSHICLSDLVSTRHRHKTAGSLPHEMPKPNNQDPLAGPCVEHRSLLSDRFQSCDRSNRPSSQLTVWICSQTSRGHTCPPSLALPHRSVTQLPSRPKL